MLYISLVASAVLLVAVNAAARRPNRPVTATAAGGLLLFGPAPLVCLAILPTVVVQAALLCVVSPLWRRAGWGPGRFLALSAGATLAAYGLLVGLSVAPTQREYARLRERFPFESVEGRLPPLPARPADAPHDPDRLAALEGRVDEEVRFDWRARELASLHERTVSQFVNSPGFGVARMSPGPTKESLTYGLRDGPAPPQPARPDASYWAPGAARPAPAETDRGNLLRLHDEGVLEFVHPRGFGLVKDRSRVAGFQAHGFSRVPATAVKWEVGRLELVSLLLHDGPVVYVSDRLPRMDEVRGGPTRPLDVFEAEGVAALRGGEDLFVRDERMVGAVRATKQCLGCHGGNRGGLLGAFSYTLRPVAP